MNRKLKIAGVIALLASAYWIYADYAGCTLDCSTKLSIAKGYCILDPDPVQCRKDADKKAKECNELCLLWLE